MFIFKTVLNVWLICLGARLHHWRGRGHEHAPQVCQDDHQEQGPRLTGPAQHQGQQYQVEGGRGSR